MRPNCPAPGRAAAADRPAADRGAPDRAPNSARAADRLASPYRAPARLAGPTLASPRAADRFHLPARRALARSRKPDRRMAHRNRAGALRYRDKTAAGGKPEAAATS